MRVPHTLSTRVSWAHPPDPPRQTRPVGLEVGHCSPRSSMSRRVAEPGPARCSGGTCWSRSRPTRRKAARLPSSMIATTLRVGAWACVIALAVLSLLPADEMVRTSLGGHAEHAIAYTGTALLTGLGYPARVYRSVLLLVAYAGVLELLQHFSPGRHSAIEDWLASSIGIVAGARAALTILSMIRSRRPGPQ